MNPVELLLRRLDDALFRQGLDRFTLQIVGSTALFAQTTYVRGTKDCDAMGAWAFPDALRARLLALAGRGTDLAQLCGVYLEFVGQGILLLPEAPRWNPWLTLQQIDVQVLDPTDVAVSKLARLHPDDLHDIEQLAERGVLTHDALVRRFLSAVDAQGFGGKGHILPRAIRNLNLVERDVFVVPETAIELPDWMDA